MPQIPVYRRQVSDQVSSRSPRVSLNAPSGAFGGTEAKNLGKLAEGLDKWSAAVGRVEEQKRVVETETLYNEWVRRDNNLLVNGGKGYLEIPGTELDEKGELRVANGGAKYTKDSDSGFEDFLSETGASGGIAEDLRRRAYARQNQNIWQIDTHESSQLAKSYEENVIAGMARAKTGYAEALIAGDDNTAADQNSQLYRYFDALAKKKGWSPESEVYSAELNKHKYSQNKAYIQEQAKTDPVKARRFLGAVSGSGIFTSVQMAELDKTLRQSETSFYSRDFADKINSRATSLYTYGDSGKPLSDDQVNSRLADYASGLVNDVEGLNADQRKVLLDNLKSHAGTVGSQREANQRALYSDTIAKLFGAEGEADKSLASETEAMAYVNQMTNAQLNERYKDSLYSRIRATYKITDPAERKRKTDFETAILLNEIQRRTIVPKDTADSFYKTLKLAESLKLNLADVKYVSNQLTQGTPSNKMYRRVGKVFKTLADQKKVTFKAKNPEDQLWKENVIRQAMVHFGQERLDIDDEEIQNFILDQNYDSGWFSDSVSENIREGEYYLATDDVISFREDRGYNYAEYMQSAEYRNTVNQVNSEIGAYNARHGTSIPKMESNSKFVATTVSMSGTNLATDLDPAYSPVKNTFAAWASFHTKVTSPEYSDSKNEKMYMSMVKAQSKTKKSDRILPAVAP